MCLYFFDKKILKLIRRQKSAKVLIYKYINLIYSFYHDLKNLLNQEITKKCINTFEQLIKC